MAWFWRGAQSAAFYYLACTPCFVRAHEKKRERERKSAKAAKSDDVEGNVYRHPLPSDTNPYWNEEIVMGPSLRTERTSKDKTKSDSTRRLNTGRESSAGESSTSTFLSLEDPREMQIVDENWNKKRYQRADEYLWGEDDANVGSYASLTSGPANRPLVSGDGAYYNAPTPAVKELHPPIISNRPVHASQALWMTQPPPTAKVMEGKERADRSRSVSNASFGSARGTGGATAGRQASLRRLTGRFRDDLPDDMDPSPPEDDGEYYEIFGQRHDRSTSDLASMDDDRRRRPPPIRISSESQQRNSRSRGSTLTRPTLPTVDSTNELDKSRLQAALKHNRSDSPISISSLEALQDRVPTKNLTNIRALSPAKEARNTQLPSATELEDDWLAYSFPADGSKEKYIQAHRWSMDI